MTRPRQSPSLPVGPTKAITPMVSWMEASACREDPDVMFPESNVYRDPAWAHARAVCASCPVLGQCFARAYNNPALTEEGVMAGLDRVQWRALREGRRVPARLNAKTRHAPSQQTAALMAKKTPTQGRQSPSQAA